ncbi:DMT family transporter [Streptomyces sp. H10-C2]|uniref:DMT family transporter n=1 Tax=unclassified Streptomyces TaxID=2593676 RepID=UPI0024BA9AF3|nr:MULTISPECIES: DMT family transporter [unclassified Streptomyces]MDJ0345048.1 DMT family transporter [Streptomyces sp. PH10-H1]MDJ0370825.1 DMT family transporter [Streptomyces sp. H10-C2]
MNTGSPVLCRTARRRLPRDRATWGHIIVAAVFCNALPFALFSVGERTVDSGVAGVLNATTPLWSLLIGVAIGTERGLHPARLGELLLGFAGTLLIFAPWQQSGRIFATGITFNLTYRLIADEGATNAATVGYLLPVVSVALGAIVLDEALNVRTIAGMAVVLVGVGMTRRPKRTAPDGPPEDLSRPAVALSRPACVLTEPVVS